MTRRIKNSYGMLLLEAIFAVVIMIVTLSIIIESLVSGLRASVLAADYSKALIMADNVMAEVLAKQGVDPSFPAEADFPEPNQQYHYELKTDTILAEENTESNLTQAHLTVSWNSGRKKHDVSLVTWFHDKLQDENPAPQ